MDTKHDLTRLNLLIQKDLPDSDIENDLVRLLLDLDSTRVRLAFDYSDSRIREVIRLGYNRLIEESKFDKQRKVIEEGAWRCTYEFKDKKHFLTPDADIERICNTVNGAYKGKPIILKRCKRCFQDRTNVRTLHQEMMEIIVLDVMKDQNCSREEAQALIARTEL